MDVLNLSDLHFNAKVDADTQFSLLAEDLRGDLDCAKLDGIILAGDIANLCHPREYELATIFTKRLMEEFKVPPEAVLIVPGNHDVDWGVTKNGFKRVPRKDIGDPPYLEYIFDPGKGKTPQACDSARYKARFDQFRIFYEAITGKPYSSEYDLQCTLLRFEREKLIFVGLNSAWPLDHLRPGIPSIRPGAINRMLGEISNIPDSVSYRKVAVWHHPIHSATDDRIREDSFVQRLAKFQFRVGIHGHVHKQGAEWFRYDSGRGMELIATGTFGAPTKELPTGTPWEYNLLRIEDNAITVESRCRDGIATPWKPYGVWREGPTTTSSRYTVPLRKMPKVPAQMYSRSQLLEFIKAEGMDPSEYRLAVEANIFNEDGRLLLQKRGPKARDERGKYEGVGGEIGQMQHNLHDCLRKEISEEIGKGVFVNIDNLFEVRPVVFEEEGRGPQDWIIVSYLCRLVSGKPRAVDKSRTSELRWFTLEEAHSWPEAGLSRSTFRFLQLYQKKYGSRPYFERAI